MCTPSHVIHARKPDSSDSADVGNGSAAPDARKRALVKITKRLDGLTANGVDDVERGMVPFLGGGRPNSGHGLPFGRDCSQIANYVNIRRIRYREILVYEHAPGIVGRRTKRAPKRRRGDSRGPDHGVARDMPSPVRHAGIVNVGHHRIEHQFDADTLELPLGVPR
jgi:hypothetical protein